MKWRESLIVPYIDLALTSQYVFYCIYKETKHTLEWMPLQAKMVHSESKLMGAYRHHEPQLVRRKLTVLLE